MWQSELLHIHNCPQGRATMQSQPKAILIVGTGIKEHRCRLAQANIPPFPIYVKSP